MVERARFRPRLPPGRVSWRRPRDRFGRPCHDRRAARREVPDSGARAHRDRGDSVNASDLEVFQTALSFIPEEMGVALRRTAYSPNIKERMDASWALFDADGRIVAQAEHIPVHLGSMPVAVDAAMRDFPGTLREGDQIILNDPYRGGTHLPDVTLIRPVFVRRVTIGFAVNRAHHADIGGRVPGSMPATAMRLEDEGLVLEPQKFMDRGRERQAVVERFRQETMNPAERLGDLRAQIAANELGARRLVELAERIGVTNLRTSIEELLDYGERRVRAAAGEGPPRAGAAPDLLVSAPPRRCGRGERRDLTTNRGRPVSRALGAARRNSPRPKPRHDEQRDDRRIRSSPVLVLRDDRRWRGRAPVPARDGRRPYAHDEHTQHAGRSPGVRVPAPDRGGPAHPRDRRPGPAFRRRRHSPLGSIPRPQRHRLDPLGASCPTPERSRRWRRRPSREEPPRAERTASPVARQGHARTATRRPARDRDPRRRRMGTARAPTPLSVAYVHRRR